MSGELADLDGDEAYARIDPCTCWTLDPDPGCPVHDPIDLPEPAPAGFYTRTEQRLDTFARQIRTQDAAIRQMVEVIDKQATAIKALRSLLAASETLTQKQLEYLEAKIGATR